MKIYRKAVKQFKLIPQDPNAQSNPNVQLLNLQSAQEALKSFEDLATAYNGIMSSLRNLETSIQDVDSNLERMDETFGTNVLSDILNVEDMNLRAQATQAISNAVMQTPAFNILVQMNFIASVENLLDATQMSNVKQQILNNISAIQSGAAQQQNTPYGNLNLKG